jgi:hypothetical protein
MGEGRTPALRFDKRQDSPRANYCANPSSELISLKPVSERFDAVDFQDGDVEPVALKERGIAFDINFFQTVEVIAACFAQLRLHFVAKMAVRFGIEDH